MTLIYGLCIWQSMVWHTAAFQSRMRLVAAELLYPPPWLWRVPSSRGSAVGTKAHPALAWRASAAHREPGRSRGPWACRSPPGEEHPHRQKHPAAFPIHHTALRGLSCRHLSDRNEAFHLTCLCYCYCLFCHTIPGGTEYI